MNKTEQKKLRGVLAAQNANAHLRAYILDRTPLHIFAAVDEYLKLDVPLPDVMRKNLRHAINALPNWKLKGNPSRNALRDVWIVTAISRRYGGKIPPKVESAFLAELAERHGMKVSAIKMVVTRFRGKIKTLN
jgi:hypothetical protein